MGLLATYQIHTLQFRFEAGTSRGTMTEKTSWLIQINDSTQPEVQGFGECGPLSGLSIDAVPDFEERLKRVCQLFNQLDLEVFPFNLPILLDQLVPTDLPSVRFGFETALIDYMSGGQRILFDNSFSKGQKSIPINGLIWMGSIDFMTRQIEEKLNSGYTTLKMKVGARDFDEECKLLGSIRTRFTPEEITLRIDANGAFEPANVTEKLKRLSDYHLHSIEQPVRPGQPELMAQLATESPVPIALDEELIGKVSYLDKFSLLKQIHPPYIILKPTLLGGFQQCREWIEIADRLEIEWWMTSALESNIGLNAIAQFTAQYDTTLPQGLGTGQLYHNNFDSPLTISKGELWYDPSHAWHISI